MRIALLPLLLFGGVIRAHGDRRTWQRQLAAGHRPAPDG
jgi:hypothetical protein